MWAAWDVWSNSTNPEASQMTGGTQRLVSVAYCRIVRVPDTPYCTGVPCRYDITGLIHDDDMIR